MRGGLTDMELASAPSNEASRDRRRPRAADGLTAQLSAVAESVGQLETQAERVRAVEQAPPGCGVVDGRAQPLRCLDAFTSRSRGACLHGAHRSAWASRAARRFRDRRQLGGEAVGPHADVADPLLRLVEGAERSSMSVSPPRMSTMRWAAPSRP